MDRFNGHEKDYRRNKKYVILNNDYCAICGRPVDKTKHFPDPMSPSVDHIIPIDKGGHPFDLANLQLTHFACNRKKSDKLPGAYAPKKRTVSNRILPLAADWLNYVADSDK